MDREIREMKNNLVGVLNSTRLPIEVKRLVVAELLKEVTDKANEVIAGQLTEREEEEHD